jgi:hypothetical protein
MNPLISIVLGITLFADKLRTGSLWIPLELVSLAVLVAGVVVLARSPLVAGSDVEGIPGEILADARGHADQTAPPPAEKLDGRPGPPPEEVLPSVS